MVAVAEEQLASVEALLAAGAQVDERNTRGRTALLIAAWYGAEEIVERLLRAGADPYAADPNGFTPVQTATLVGDTIAINYFRAFEIARRKPARPAPGDASPKSATPAAPAARPNR
jgi:ankyrin repeat protein